MSAEWACAAAARRLSLVSAPQPALARSTLTSRSTSAVGPDASVFPPPFVPPVWVGFFVGLPDAFVGADEDATGGADETGAPESVGNVPGVSSPPGALAGGGSSPAAAGVPGL